ncbi:MAG: hypothetical protein ACHQIM_15330 [Sphingobacteriales bacterium]
MTDQEKNVIQILLQSESKNLAGTMQDLNDLVGILVSINEELKIRKAIIKPWQKYLEIQSIKFIFHTSSLFHLLKGTPLNPDGRLVHDIGSIFLLRRAQIENYLMFYYLNIQPKSDNEALLRILFFDLGGLAHRQGFTATTKDNINKKNKELSEIDYLLTEIKKNAFFQTLHIQKQNDLLERKPPRIIGWEKLIESSHLKTENTIQLWKYYSNYAHSEMIGIIQIEDYIRNPEHLKETVYYTAEQTLIITCVILQDFLSTFPELQELQSTLPQLLKSKIDFWNKICKE